MSMTKKKKPVRMTNPLRQIHPTGEAKYALVSRRAMARTAFTRHSLQ